MALTMLAKYQCIVHIPSNTMHGIYAMTIVDYDAFNVNCVLIKKRFHNQISQYIIHVPQSFLPKNVRQKLIN